MEYEASKISSDCYNLADSVIEIDESARRELILLCSFVQGNKPQFSAAGFFRITRSTMLSLLGVTVTYVIVALQLR